MLLTEIEGKQLLKKFGLQIPRSIVVTSPTELPSKIKEAKAQNWSLPIFCKAQVLHGNRARQGLVVSAKDWSEAAAKAAALFAKSDQNGQPITEILLEEGLPFSTQLYLSFSYDTASRGPVLRFSQAAGEGIEERAESLITHPFSIESGPDSIFKDPAFSDQLHSDPSLTQVISQLWHLFLAQDCSLLEINPLVKSDAGWFCLDAKIELENTARFRHPEWENYPQRSQLGRPPTKREIQAHQVNQLDHRGTAGESFFEFPGGTIGVLASGGGASALVMDALLSTGLKPANYTEYSGNPTAEKVKALAEVVFSIPNLEGLWIVGGNANFTDILETLTGIMDAFLDSPYSHQPGFALLIRRGGPNWQAAFEMVQQKTQHLPLKIQLLGPDFPLVKTASAMKSLLEQPISPEKSASAQP